jgi:hypothetical protein
MESVAGIGGLFFRARDPAALGRWYQEHLGITPPRPSGYGEWPWRQEVGPTVCSPFPESTNYFGDSKQVWMINFRVHELDAMDPKSLLALPRAVLPMPTAWRRYCPLRSLSKCSRRRRRRREGSCRPRTRRARLNLLAAPLGLHPLLRLATRGIDG